MLDTEMLDTLPIPSRPIEDMPKSEMKSCNLYPENIQICIEGSWGQGVGRWFQFSNPKGRNPLETLRSVVGEILEEGRIEAGIDRIGRREEHRWDFIISIRSAEKLNTIMETESGGSSSFLRKRGLLR